MRNEPSPPHIPLTACEDMSQEDAFHLVLNNLEDTFFLLDKYLCVLISNDATRAKAKEYFGVTVKQGTSILQLAPPEKHTFLKKLFAEVLGGSTRWTETELTVNGVVNYLRHCFKPARNSEGHIIGVLVSTKNVTDKKKADAQQQEAKEQLKLSEQHYKTLFQTIPLPCWIFEESSFRFLEVNEAATRYYGYSKEEFLNLTILQIQLEQNVTKLKNNLRPHRTKPYSLNNWHHRIKDGRVIFVDLRITPINYHGKKAKLVVVHDVTPKVITENELRKSNERFRLAANASSEALWEWDVLTEEAYISQTYTDIFGWKADEFRKFDKWPDYIHPEDKKETIESYDTALENKAFEKWEKEYRYLKSDGTYAFVHDKAIILRNEEGKPVKIIGALQNITGRKEIEAELKKSNERFLLASRAASDAIYEWDIVTNEVYWGEGLQSLFGYQSHELTMGVWETLIHQQERERTIRSLSEALAHPEKMIWRQEYRLGKPDGSFSYVLERGFIVRDSEGKALRMIGSLQDISGLKFHESLLSLERSIFELSASPDIELIEVVNTLLKGVEEIHYGALASILLIKDNEIMEHLAAPSLPLEFTSGISGIRVGPEEGSCGAAISQKKTIIASDIDSAPVWQKHKHFASRFHLKACWSLPIIHSSGKVIGCFAIYYKTCRTPTHAELLTAERLRNILRIVIENRWSLQEIKTAHERFDIMMRATHDLIWDWNLKTNIIYRDPAGLRKVYGIQNNDLIDTLPKWLIRVHPEDQAKVKTVMNKVLEATKKNNFDMEYRFKKENGSYSYVFDRGIIIRDESGDPIRMIGAAQDISERKRLERELLNNELEHQKAINRATIETQEQERTQIGKELQDNVNQVLTTTKLYLDLALSNPELKDELIQKSSKNIINIINEIRQLSQSLMDPSIGDLGLIDSIRDLIENINLTRKLHVSLKVAPRIEQLLDQNQKLTIFRILQETLNNAVKHAKASTVIIQFLYHTSSAELIIEDDGIGFDVQTVKKGAGLKNIQNRIYLINGTHIIKSVPGKGSKIIINFPLLQTNTLYTN